MGIEEQTAYERARCRANRHEPKTVRLQEFIEKEIGEDPTKHVHERDVTISAWEETRCQFCDLLLDSTDRVSDQHNYIHKIHFDFGRDEMPDQVWNETKTQMWHGSEYTEISSSCDWFGISQETADYLNSVLLRQKTIRQYAIDCQVDPDKIKIITPHQELNGAMMLNPNLAKLAIKWKAKSMRDAQK